MSNPLKAVSFLLATALLVEAAKAQWLLNPTPQAAQNDPFLYRDTWSVLVDDWNGDGNADLFFANDPHQSQLLFGNGAWLIRSTALLSPARAAATADLDGDGDRDLVLVSSGIQVLRNNGAGAFAAIPIAYPYSGASCVALGDVDGDGDRDLIVGHLNQQNRLYRNNGQGSFTEALGGLPFFNDATTAVQLVDVDGDGDLDLIAGNDWQPTRLALNNGSGVFLDVTGTHLPSFSVPVYSMEAADIDGDGDIDLGVGVWASHSRLLINDGTGHFTDDTSARLPLWSGSMCTGVAWLDVDLDLDLDFIVTAYLGPTRVFRNDGTGHFADHTFLLLPNFVCAGRCIGLGDIDGDGRRDAIIGCEDLGSSPEPRGQNHPLQNLQAGLVRREMPMHEPWGGMLPNPMMEHINAMVLVDHDHDGDLDLFVGRDFGAQDRLYDNDGRGVFTDVTQVRLPIEMGNTVEVAAGDVNGDSWVDLVLTRFEGPASLWLGSAGGGFTDVTAARMPSVSMRAIAVTLGDIDGDGDRDIVFGVDGQSRVFTNNGQGFFTDATQFSIVPMNVMVTAVELADLDGDNDLDLLMSEPLAVTRYVNNGSGVFTPVAIPGLPTLLHSRTVAADFDGDGDRDIFCTSAVTNAASWRLLRNNGNGTFVVGSPASGASGRESTMTAVDFDGDGDIDIVATSVPELGQFGTNRLYRNDGSGSFAIHAFPGQREFSRAGVVGDVDADGDPDVLVGNRFWFSNGARLGHMQLFANTRRHVSANAWLHVGGSASIVTRAVAANGPASLLACTFAATAGLPASLSVPPFGELWLDPSAIVILASGFTVGSAFTSSVAIPNDPGLVGIPLYFQSLVEGRTSTNQPELRFTNVTRETIQP